MENQALIKEHGALVVLTVLVRKCQSCFSALAEPPSEGEGRRGGQKETETERQTER